MRFRLLSIFLASLLGTASLRADFEFFIETPEGQPFSNRVAFEFLSNYATLAWYLYSDAVRSAVHFNMAVYRFRKEPGAETFEAAKTAWVEARKVYGRTEVYRFSEGPIDNLELEILINAWPIDESYIDYTRDDPLSGIVNRPEMLPEITSLGLRRLNQTGGEANVSTGWHAIEFLLWGQDHFADGPGRREWTDYTTAPNADRRMAYLVSSTELLRIQLVAVAEEWSLSNYDNHTGDFFLKRPITLIKQIMRGVTSLAGRELAAERMSLALRSKSQEDEHSCFSDTTHLDLIANVEGIEAILTGEFDPVFAPPVAGKGLLDLIADADPAAAEAVREKFAVVKERVGAIDPPFDQAIMAEENAPAYQKVKASVQALWALVYALADATEILQLDVKRG